MGENKDIKKNMDFPSVAVTIRDGGNVYHINLSDNPGNPFPFRVVSTASDDDPSASMNMEQFQRVLSIMKDRLDPAKLQDQHQRFMNRDRSEKPAANAVAGKSKGGSMFDIIYGNTPPKKNT